MFVHFCHWVKEVHDLTCTFSASHPHGNRVFGLVINIFFSLSYKTLRSCPIVLNIKIKRKLLFTEHRRKMQNVRLGPKEKIDVKDNENDENPMTEP